MLKIIHTSDWHLGQNFYGYDRSEEQRDFLRQLADIAREHKPDALLVSGDIFHTAAPSNSAVNLYVEEMLNIHKACETMSIIVIAGNHDSASRLDCDKRLWELAGVTVIGSLARNEEGSADLDRHIIRVRDKDNEVDKGIIAAVPFAYPSSFPKTDAEGANRQEAYFDALLHRVEEQNTSQLPVVLMAHLAVNNSDFTGHDRNMKMECVEISSLGEGYDYAALGHIHRPQDVSERARYCGTPIPVSFDEQCEHSVSIVVIDRHNDLPRIETKRIKNLRPLHTIPANEPVELDAALDEVAISKDIARAYIRLNVLVEQFLPNGAQERAANAVSAQLGRFCEIKKTARVVASGLSQQMSMEEFNSKQPIEVANQYYIDTWQREMTEREKEMFNYVYQLVEEENRNETQETYHQQYRID